MEPEHHVVCLLQGPGDRSTLDHVVASYEGTRAGFKLAADERDRAEAEYLAHHPSHTDDGREVAFEVATW